MKWIFRAITGCVFITVICRCMKTVCKFTFITAMKSFIVKFIILSAAVLSSMKNILVRMLLTK